MLPPGSCKKALSGARSLRDPDPLANGLDPEMVAAGITLAGYHLERRVLTFAKLSKVMRDELEGDRTDSEVLDDYLEIWYAGAAGLLGLGDCELDQGNRNSEPC